MKHIFLMSVVSAVLLSCDKESLMKAENFPEPISNYIETHFPEHGINLVIQDKEGIRSTYDVALEGGYFLEFNKKYELIDAEGSLELPESVIPVTIREYVTANFPDNQIIAWELENRNQQIKLNNELQLEFNIKGEFLRIDQ